MPLNADLPPIGHTVPPVLELKQFWRTLGSTYCFKEKCEGCRWERTCEREETDVKIGPGLNIRRGFRARPGTMLVAIDYKGIELRVAAQLSGESFWVDAYLYGRDPHTEMAKAAFKTDKPTKSQRDAAKCANFGNLYLGTAMTLQRQSALDLPEAIYLHSEWWSRVQTYKAWTEAQKRQARAEKAVYTFFGRKRDLTRLIDEAENPKKRKPGQKSGWGFIERTSVNSPVQGTSADLIKIAMVNVHSWLEKDLLLDKIRMLLTVHDELVFEVPDDQYLFDTARIIAKKMCPDLKPFNWRVPIECDIEIGPNWAELTDIKHLDKNAPKDNGVAKETKPSIPRDGILLTVNAQLTDKVVTKVKDAVYRASTVDTSVKVPLKLRIAGQVYRRSGTVDKVNEGVLRRELSGIPGVEITDFFEEGEPQIVEQSQAS